MQPRIIKKKFELKQYACDDFPLFITTESAQGDHALHSHDFIELVLVESGKGVHITRNTRVPISTGDVIIIPRGVRHGYEDVEEFKVINVIFDISLLGSVYGDLNHIPGFHSLFHLPGRKRWNHARYEFSSLDSDEITYAGRLVRKMLSELKKKAPGYKTVCSSALMELAAYLSRKEFKKSNTGGENKLDRVLDYMEKNHREKITVGELAKIACSSVRNFQRVFHQIVGKSPNDHLLSIRMRHAKKLLTDSSMGISEIALETGFSDSSYFTCRFKGVFGATPKIYRAVNSSPASSSCWNMKPVSS